VTVSNTTLLAWASMANNSIPLWENGDSWIRWDPEFHYGTFLDVDNTGTRTIELEERCSVLWTEKKRSLETLLEMQIRIT
jgi:hypothetical protein